MKIPKPAKLTPKMLDGYIKQQELFLGAVALSLALMKSYKRDPRNLTFIGSKLKVKVGLDKEDFEKFIYESFDEIGDLAAFSGSLGIVNAGGLFNVIELVSKNKKVHTDDLIKFIESNDFENI